MFIPIIIVLSIWTHIHMSGVEVKSIWNYNSTPPYSYGDVLG
jgi:hypothetical protein